LLLATASTGLLVVWAVSGAVGEGEARDFAAAPVFAISAVQLAALVNTHLHPRKAHTVHSLGHVKSLCSVQRRGRDEGVLFSLVVGTSAGYLVMLDCHFLDDNTSLKPATMSLATPVSGQLAKQVQVLQSRVRWCLQACSGPVDQLISTGGGEGVLGVQSGQRCWVLPIHEGAGADSDTGGLQAQGEAGGMVSGLCLARALGHEAAAGSEASTFSLIVATVDGVLRRWAFNPEEKRLSVCSPAFPFLTCGRVVSGLCLDPLQLMGAAVSKSSDTAKRFGNPLVQHISLAPLPCVTGLSSLRDLPGLRSVLKSVLGSVAAQPRVSLAGLLIFLQFEVSRLSDPLLQGSLHQEEDLALPLEVVSFIEDSVPPECLCVEEDGRSGSSKSKSKGSRRSSGAQKSSNKKRRTGYDSSGGWGEGSDGLEQLEQAEDEDEDFVGALQAIADSTAATTVQGSGQGSGGLVSAEVGSVLLGQALVQVAALELECEGSPGEVEEGPAAGATQEEEIDVAASVRAATTLLRIPSASGRYTYSPPLPSPLLLQSFC
jgi:hypothetical protein